MLLGAADSTTGVLVVALVVVLACIAVKVYTDTCTTAGLVLGGDITGPQHGTLSGIGTGVSGEITGCRESALGGCIVEPAKIIVEHPVCIVCSAGAALPELVLEV